MTAKELIKQLKNLPQNLEVGIAAHDNNEWEAVGWPQQIYHVIKNDFKTHIDGVYEEDIFNSLPNEYIVIHC